jgi:hypothetical protein
MKDGKPAACTCQAGTYNPEKPCKHRRVVELLLARRPEPAPAPRQLEPDDVPF